MNSVVGNTPWCRRSVFPLPLGEGRDDSRPTALIVPPLVFFRHQFRRSHRDRPTYGLQNPLASLAPAVEVRAGPQRPDWRITHTLFTISSPKALILSREPVPA